MMSDEASLLSEPPPVSTCEIKEQLGFLRAVHVSSSRGEGSLLADGTRLRAAVRTELATEKHTETHSGKQTEKQAHRPQAGSQWGLWGSNTCI